MNQNKSNTFEQKIFDIWSQILQSRNFSFNDNFFDCGGNSLNLVYLQHELENSFNVSIPLVELFKNSTISKMAVLIYQKETSKKASGEISV
jgi:acyl carrier protein